MMSSLLFWLKLKSQTIELVKYLLRDKNRSEIVIIYVLIQNFNVYVFEGVLNNTCLSRNFMYLIGNEQRFRS